VLIKASVEGFSSAARMSTSVIHGERVLKEMCLEQDEKMQRGDVDIWCYQLQHEGGLYFLYQNKTKELVLREEIAYELGGLEIEGQQD